MQRPSRQRKTRDIAGRQEKMARYRDQQKGQCGVSEEST